MAATAVIHIDLTIVSVATGLWCPACLLPSGVQTLVALSWRKDPTKIVGHFTARCCDDCGRPIP